MTTAGLKISDDDVTSLMAAVNSCYGYNFNGYSLASLKRRVNRIMELDKHPSLAEFRYKLVNDPDYFAHFIEELTVNITEMFRDPWFYVALKESVLPQLATYANIRIWHAGCSTGEEVLSMAIVLKEAGLLDRTLLYATDVSQNALESARTGMIPLKDMKQYSENYNQAKGSGDFSDYYTAMYEYALFSEELREKIVFATHNLVSDQSFNDFQLIICRNVLIYFKAPLQQRVIELFHTSMVNFGYLALGPKESLILTGRADDFTVIDHKAKIWRKKS